MPWGTEVSLIMELFIKIGEIKIWGHRGTQNYYRGKKERDS